MGGIRGDDGYSLQNYYMKNIHEGGAQVQVRECPETRQSRFTAGFESLERHQRCVVNR